MEVIQTMTTTTGKATGSFTIKAWDKQPWAEVEEAPKLTHARVTTAYTGDLEGEGTCNCWWSTRGPTPPTPATSG